MTFAGLTGAGERAALKLGVVAKAGFIIAGFTSAGLTLAVGMVAKAGLRRAGLERAGLVRAGFSATLEIAPKEKEPGAGADPTKDGGIKLGVMTEGI